MCITLDLPMPVRRVESNPQVMANRGRVALQRGPIVFAAEWPDNPNGKVRNIVLPDGNALRSEFRRDLLNGVQVITGRAVGLAFDAKGVVQRTEQPFMAIPYATWANRGRGQMAVWLARADAAARPTPFPTVVTTATIAASPLPNGRGKNPRNIIDGEEPASSADSTAYFDWWPVQGSNERVGRVDVRETVDGVDALRSTGSTIPAAAACACRHRGGCSTSRAPTG